MPVVTRSAARKLAQQQATEPEPSVRESRKRVCKAAPEKVTATVTPSATGKGTRWNCSSSSPARRSAIRPYPPPTYIGLPALPEEVTFSDASEASIERFNRLASSSGGVPIASGSSSLYSIASLGSTNNDIGRAYTPAPATPPPPPSRPIRNRKPFPPRTPEKKAVPRPLQRSPAIRIEPVSPVLPGPCPPVYTPGTRLTLIEDDVSPEGIARCEYEHARRTEAITAKYWAELLADKKERDRYLLGGLELLEAQGLAPPHVNCPVHPDHGFNYRRPWVRRRSVTPFDALTR